MWWTNEDWLTDLVRKFIAILDRLLSYGISWLSCGYGRPFMLSSAGQKTGSVQESSAFRPVGLAATFACLMQPSA